MAAEKLYYQNQYMRSFTAELQKSGRDEQGRFYVILDQTAFYPTGGGQPHDTGTLNGEKVIDVEEVDGEIRHFLAEPIDLGPECVGEINWERRFDHMQQHAGQHILSAAFDNLYEYNTVSFHLGKEICTIDIKTEQLTEEKALQVENTANKIILENRPIEAKWVTESELSNYSLRKDLSVSENIRLVIIPDFDYSGCGGTHPSSTGQISAIKILHWEKEKKNTRISFVCGNRVMKQLHEKHRVIQNLTSILSSPQERLPEAAKRILEQIKDSEKTIEELRLKLIEHEAAMLSNQAQQSHSRNRNVVKAIFTDRPMGELQLLAKWIAANTENNVVLILNETDVKLQLVLARSKDVNINMNDLLKQVLPIINGKGGGTESFVQGGGDKTVPPEDLLEKLISLESTL